MLSSSKFFSKLSTSVASKVSDSLAYDYDNLPASEGDTNHLARYVAPSALTHTLLKSWGPASVIIFREGNPVVVACSRATLAMALPSVRTLFLPSSFGTFLI